MKSKIYLFVGIIFLACVSDTYAFETKRCTLSFFKLKDYKSRIKESEIVSDLSSIFIKNTDTEMKEPTLFSVILIGEIFIGINATIAAKLPYYGAAFIVGPLATLQENSKLMLDIISLTGFSALGVYNLCRIPEYQDAKDNGYEMEWKKPLFYNIIGMHVNIAAIFLADRFIKKKQITNEKINIAFTRSKKKTSILFCFSF